MKKSILTLALFAIVSLTAASCSTDDSALDNNTSADELGMVDNGNKDLPKPPQKP